MIGRRWVNTLGLVTQILKLVRGEADQSLVTLDTYLPLGLGELMVWYCFTNRCQYIFSYKERP